MAALAGDAPRLTYFLTALLLGDLIFNIIPINSLY